MPKFGRLFYAGVEIQIIRGESNTSVSLDDIARGLGYEAADEVVEFLDILGLGDEAYPVDLPRGEQWMASLAASVKLAESFDSIQTRQFAAYLRKEMAPWDLGIYDGFPPSERRIFAAPVRATSQRPGDQAGLPPHVAS